MPSTQTYAQTASDARTAKLLFVDDHHILLDGLTRLVSEEFEARGVATLRGIEALLDVFQPDLVVTDLHMPDGQPLELLREWRRSHPDVQWLLLSTHTDARDVKRAMDAGARGYVSKRATAGELLSAIRTVLGGGRYVSPQTLMLPADAPFDNVPLTVRQKEVLRLIARGFSAKDIARDLRISARTAEFHRATIMDRLKLSSTAALTRYAIDHGLA